MKQKYFAPQTAILVLDAELVIANSTITEPVHSDDPQAPSDALVKDGSFDFSWE